MIISKYINKNNTYDYVFESEEMSYKNQNTDTMIINLIDFQFNDERLRHGCRLVVFSYDKRKKLFSCKLNGFNVFMTKEEVFNFFK